MTRLAGKVLFFRPVPGPKSPTLAFPRENATAAGDHDFQQRLPNASTAQDNTQDEDRLNYEKGVASQETLVSELKDRVLAVVASKPRKVPRKVRLCEALHARAARTLRQCSRRLRKEWTVRSGSQAETRSKAARNPCNPNLARSAVAHTAACAELP